MNKNFEKKLYTALFNVLDNFYNETANDSLGALLGSMNPFLFEDTDSADCAVFDDFCECFQAESNVSDSADSMTGYLAAIRFLTLYRDNFGFDMNNIIQQFEYESFLREFELI